MKPLLIEISTNLVPRTIDLQTSKRPPNIHSTIRINSDSPSNTGAVSWQRVGVTHGFSGAVAVPVARGAVGWV